MNFCPKCGMLMYPDRNEKSVKLICKSCGYQQDVSSDLRGKFIVKREIEHSPRDKTLLLENDQLEVMPTMKTVCPKCGNTTAYYWQVQTRRADEASTTFLRCTSCKHTWRIY